MAHHESSELPFVSVVIPVFNEERYIEACLASVLDQDYPADRYEVIVADGGSTDRTRAIVESTSVLHPNVRLIDNPGRTQAHGLNLAILASRGEFIARQDGHAEWSPHHLRRSIELLLETGADNVGGRADGEGAGITGTRDRACDAIPVRSRRSAVSIFDAGRRSCPRCSRGPSGGAPSNVSASTTKPIRRTRTTS